MRPRKLTSPTEIESIICKSTYCTVGMIDEEGLPYVIPMNFGYADHTLYLHGGSKGKKLKALEKNKQVCVNFSTDLELYHQNIEIGCSYSMKYRSAMLYGKVNFIENIEEKKQILYLIMSQYTNNKVRFCTPALKNVCIMKIAVERLEGRVLGY